MSGRATGFEVVFLIKDRSKLADFEWLSGGANVEGRIRLNPRSEGYRGSHDSPTMQNRDIMSSQKAEISRWWESHVFLPIALPHSAFA